MIKKIFLIVLLLFFGFYQNEAKAENNFFTEAKIEYKLHNSGRATVTKTITLKNITTEFYATSYVLNLEDINPTNLKAYESGNRLDLKTLGDKNNLRVNVTFSEPLVGIGKTRTFAITYETDILAVKTGNIWELSIPKLTAFDFYKIDLSVPSSFGNLSYISPLPEKTDVSQDRKIYTFTKNLLANQGISAGFGKFQIFSFDINFHLENPLNKTSETQIAIPPDTSTQKVYYQKIDPQPLNVEVDEDGNWLALYSLKPREKKDIKVSGLVHIYAFARKTTRPSPSVLLANIQPEDYWQADDPEIKALAKALQTPEKIYKFVVEKLNYDYQRVKPNVKRLGAKEALENPNNAICVEFTDLFIALARAAGIPGREINGYAYTENLRLQPLSLVADVLHSWPEYWDDKENTWIPVDPTWASTTGGVDYFNKLDLRHFAFVIHGQDPEKPYPPGSYKLGANPEKDVFVVSVPSESYLTQNTDSLRISFSKPLKSQLFGQEVKITLENNGQTAAYEIFPITKFDDRIVKSDYLLILPPFAKYETSVSVPQGFLAKNMPETIITEAAGIKATFPTNKNEVVIYQISIILFIPLSVLLVLHIQSVKKKIKKVLRKNYGHQIKKVLFKQKKSEKNA